MPNPRQVKEQEELATLEQQLYAPEPAPTDPPAQPAATPDNNAPAAAPAPPPPVVPEPEHAAWEQRYKVLEGKYRAEVPRLNQELKDVRTKLEQLTAEKKTEPLVKPEEVDRYGGDFIDMVQRAAEEKIGPERKQLEQTIATLQSQIAVLTQGQSSIQSRNFTDDLTRLAPDWQKVDEDPKWHAWLATNDPMARRQRQALLDEAIGDSDAAYVAQLITTWKATAQVPAPSSPRIESRIEPDTRRGLPPAPAANSGKLWTEADVTEFYSKLSRGQIKADEGERIEQEIQTAIREGRYRKR